MLAECTREEIVAALDEVALDLLMEADIDTPPVNALAVARRLNIVVAEDARQDARARYVRLAAARGAQPAILLRPEPRAERRQWAVAHEIGEHAVKRVFDRLGIPPELTRPTAREAAANQLAGRLLLPSRWFAQLGQECQWDLLKLKNQFATASHELIARRMLECRPGVIVSIFDQGRCWFRRSNILGRVPPLSPSESRCQQRAHRVGRPQRHQTADRQTQCWPVHEPGWKREILRVELWDFDFASQ